MKNKRRWKDGSVLYFVGYRLYDCFSIPHKVFRVKVRHVTDYWYDIEACNKKYGSYLGPNNHRYADSRGNWLDIFQTKKEAEDCLKQRQDAFKELHAQKLYDSLVNELRKLDDEKRKIWGVMRMNVIKER